MIARPFGLQIAAMITALGIFLGAVAPALAVPQDANTMSDMTMAGMTMDGSCMEAALKSMPTKQLPEKSNRSSCTLCISCAVNIDSASVLTAPAIWRRTDRLMGSDSNSDGVAIVPALPPPISNA